MSLLLCHEFQIVIINWKMVGFRKLWAEWDAGVLQDGETGRSV